MTRISNMDQLSIVASTKIKEKKYWHNKLAEEFRIQSFPYDLVSSQTDKVIKSLDFSVKGESFAQLMRLSNNSPVSLHMILVAAISILLKKFTYVAENQHNHVIVGTPIYRQEVSGEFANTILPIISDVVDEITLKEYFLKIKETIQEALQYYCYPIEVLANDFGLANKSKVFSLLDVMILLENIQDRRDIEHFQTKVLFTFKKESQSILGRVEYNSSFYLELSMQRIIDHLLDLLGQLADNIDTPLVDIDIVTDGEKHQLLSGFSRQQSRPSRLPTIHNWFERQVDKTPDKIAVCCLSEQHQGCNEQITYRELNHRANQLATELKRKGTKAGNIVGLILDPSIERIIAIMAVLKTGSAYYPIDPQYPVHRILSILQTAEISLLITHASVLKTKSYTLLQGLEHQGIEPYKTNARLQSDFNKLPHPERSLVNLEKYSHYIGHAMVRHAVSMQATRGCPYKCAFCHRTMDMKNVSRRAENIFEEVKYYYTKGVRRFSFVDEIFNLDSKNSSAFFRLILKNRLKVQLFFPNGMRADRLSREYIDLMVDAGTVNVGLALETASVRLQKLIQKNMNIDKLRENAQYFCDQYPHVILELFTMHGFPSESEEEALSTLEFIKSMKWIHFPYVFLLKIHPSTAMMQLALDHGISKESIESSMTSAFHEIPETLPYPKSFTRQYVARFMNEYFLSKERLRHVLPYQMKICTEKELVCKYDNYLPAKIKNYVDILQQAGLSQQELGNVQPVNDDSPFIPDYQSLHIGRKSRIKPDKDAFKILLLDLSVLFSDEEKDILHGEITEPLGLVYLLTYLNETFREKIHGKIYKSKVDFDSYSELRDLLNDFQPDLIGIRTLSYFKDFFHKTVSLIKDWGIHAPIIAGGPYGTSDYKLVLQDANVELTVLKEGEITLAELVNEMINNNKQLPDEEKLKTIKGIAYIHQPDKKNLKKKNRRILLLEDIFECMTGQPADDLQSPVSGEDLLYLISTSGSSGIPKNVMIEHDNLANLMDFQFSNSNLDFDRVLQFASFGFDVSAQELFSTLLSGGELVVIDKESKDDLHSLFRIVEKCAITTLFLPPGFLKNIFSDSEISRKFPTLVKHIVSAGEQLIVPQNLKTYLQKNRVYLHNHYGPSESHVVTALTLSPQDFIEERPAIGKPIAKTDIYLLDARKQLMPLGGIGEVYIAGKSVGRGYFNQKEQTLEKFSSDLFKKGQRLYRSGDLARWRPDGHLEFIGRIDNQVKIRGYRIELEEIEQCLQHMEEIVEAVVVDREDHQNNRYLCAYVVAKGPGGKYSKKTNNQAELDVNNVIKKLARKLPEYMIPSHFVVMQAIPLTINGKVNRRKLPEPLIEKRDYQAPRNDIESRLQELWSEVLCLGKEKIGINHNFFELGGHSLKATILVAKIHRVFNVEIYLKEMFKSPTIKDLAVLIESLQSASAMKVNDKNRVERLVL